MNANIKRILFIFSVALNISFIITSAVRIYCHPLRSQDPHYFRKIETAIKNLNLPHYPKETVQKIIKDFKNRHDEGNLKFKQTRNEIFSLLSMPGPFNQNKFEALHSEVHRQNVQEEDDIKNHLIELRKLLGNEKGAQFFSILLKESQSEKGFH